MEKIVLLIEDDPADARLIQRAFEKAFAEVRISRLPNGDDAVAYLAGEAPFDNRNSYPLPAVILLDIKLPRRSGFEVLSWLRARKDGLNRIPIVMLTSSRHSVDVNRAYDLRANPIWQSLTVTINSRRCFLSSISIGCLIMNSRLSEPHGMVDSPALGTILLVEDDAADATLLIRAFTKSGVANPIRHLRDGEQALAYLEGIGELGNREKNPLPILILLDLRLPRMSGLELLQWMRPRKHVRRIPVVILTAERDPSYMEAAYDLGANSYLIKSPKEEDVLRLVELIQQYWIGLNEPAPLILESRGPSFGTLHM